MCRKKSTRGGISKNKETVRKWARKEGRTRLWLDDEGRWHAAVGDDSVPHYAVSVEAVGSEVNPNKTMVNKREAQIIQNEVKARVKAQAVVHTIPPGQTAKVRLLDGPVEAIECGAVIAIEEKPMMKLIVEIDLDENQTDGRSIQLVKVNGEVVELDDRQNGAHRVWFIYDDPRDEAHSLFIEELFTF